MDLIIYYYIRLDSRHYSDNDICMVNIITIKFLFDIILSLLILTYVQNINNYKICTTCKQQQLRPCLTYPNLTNLVE